jgi:hypothetical protein
VDVRLLTRADDAAYGALVASRSDSLIYLSLAYRNFLEEMLPHGRAVYLAAEEDGRIVGVLPAFVGDSVAYGKVINSLPFFGSHGGVVVAPDHADSAAVKRLLLRAFKELVRQEGARAFTVISSPFEPDNWIYVEELQPTHRDERIGQISPLPTGADENAVADRLMESFHQKTRNMVRKGLKGGFTVRQSVDGEDLIWLQRVHEQNMIAAGASPKPLAVFQALQKYLGSDHCIYIAESGTDRAAGLLVLFFNGRAEYYTPAIVEQYRNDQALSLVIFHAMQHAVQRGAHEWNWGGTAPHLDAIHRFKKRWNAADLPYYYYIGVLDPGLAGVTTTELSAALPYFYLFPFNKPRAGDTGNA